MSQTNIITGQYVKISQSPASLASRIAAWLIDIIAIIIYTTGITYILIEISPDIEGSFSLVIFLFLVYFPAFGYPLLCEMFFNGQSLGKRLLKIRVVKKDGSIPTLGDYVMRWLLFIIDGPMLGCLGILFILLSKDSQRLGDMAAGTMVIKLNGYSRNRVSLSEFGYVSGNYVPYYPQAADLTLKQADVIKRCLQSEERHRIIRISRLAQKLRTMFGVSSIRMGDEQFLVTILHDYQYYALEGV
ncbi:MAG: RDD family protein [Prevotella sp.]|uniref:RDD family protein n=1 Tax=Prevotella sp. TaxID=59823 RepID=UPI002A25D5EE|nr:RDD family protein [Prevotella sp.]MDD7317561.1 RDD family protein [Prevotellaceae bacterium]MDY4020592.1 RDD family protein [Prevotella sp.]